MDTSITETNMDQLVKEAMEVASPYTRHLGIFNPHKHQLSATVIGCGAIGSFVAVGLAKMGVRDQTLYDFDTVEEVNIPVQLHGKQWLGANKAEATRQMIDMFSAEKLNITVKAEKWIDQPLKTDLVIAAVDDLDVRKAIWMNVKYDNAVKVLLDARIGGQAMKIYAVNPTDDKDIKEYDKSLASTKGSELPCTERGVIDVSLFASALLIRAARRWVVAGKKETYRVILLDADFPNIIG
jgi:molybdopterin/thiamine biosynthesis adenylyltransferase